MSNPNSSFPPASNEIGSSASTATLIETGVVPITVEYYQRELAFWREETVKLRAQVEQLSKENKPSPVSEDHQSPVVEEAKVTTTQEDPSRAVHLALPAFFARIAMDSELERKMFKLAKMVTYFVFCVLLAWRVLVELPFFILIPILVVGLALGFPSNSIFRS
ncbi:hypothetical protein JCM3765_004661 [Sporobolomyces pararoseus]